MADTRSFTATRPAATPPPAPAAAAAAYGPEEEAEGEQLGFGEVCIPTAGKPGFFIVFNKVWPFASVLNVLSTVYTDLVFCIQQAYTDAVTGERVPPAFVARNIVADQSCMTGLKIDPDHLGAGHWYCHATVTICAPMAPLNKHIGTMPQQSQCILWTNSDDPEQLFVAHRRDASQVWNGILAIRLRDMGTVSPDSYYRDVPPVLSMVMQARVASSFLTECFQVPKKTDPGMSQITVVVVPEHHEAATGIVRPTTLAFLASSAMCSLTYTVAHGQECSTEFRATVMMMPADSEEQNDVCRPIVARYPLPILGLVTKSGVQIGSVVDILLLLYHGVPEPHLGIFYTVGEGGLGAPPLGSLDIIVSPERITDADTAAELVAVGRQFSRMIARSGFSSGTAAAAPTAGTVGTSTTAARLLPPPPQPTTPTAAAEEDVPPAAAAAAVVTTTRPGVVPEEGEEEEVPSAQGGGDDDDDDEQILVAGHAARHRLKRRKNHSHDHDYGEEGDNGGAAPVAEMATTTTLSDPQPVHAEDAGRRTTSFASGTGAGGRTAPASLWTTGRWPRA